MPLHLFLLLRGYDVPLYELPKANALPAVQGIAPTVPKSGLLLLGVPRPALAEPSFRPVRLLAYLLAAALHFHPLRLAIYVWVTP